MIAGSEIVRRMEPGWRDAAPGTVLKVVTAAPRTGGTRGTGPVVKCGDTALMLTMLKPEGGSLMDGAAFLRGRQLTPGKDMLLEN